MNDPLSTRKQQHLDIIAFDRESDRDKRYFDAIRLTHRALPEMDLNEVDPSITFLGKRLSMPLLISSMTGGVQEELQWINRNLAQAAEEAGVAMAVGSQRVMFSEPAARTSFELRPYAPNALLLANLGAVQLNRGFDASQCNQAIEVLRADALYLHLNPLQECIQQEGDTCFRGLAAKLASVTQQISAPVVIKEVGAGISGQDALLIMNVGIQYIDVAGSGGTSWSRIEQHRRETGHVYGDIGLLFQDWGIPTPLALQTLAPYGDRLTLIASGGLRSGIDMLKAIMLGASLCGLARPFLDAARDSAQQVLRVIERLRRELTLAMFLTGCRTFQDAWRRRDLILERCSAKGEPS